MFKGRKQRGQKTKMYCRLCYLDTSSKNKYRNVSDTGAHLIRCGYVSDTSRDVSNYFIYFDQRIRSPIRPDTSPICPNTS
jgi:hypothetical protein